MIWIDYLRRLYSLDTLDTRFTTSSRTPPKQVAAGADAPIDPARPSQPSWRRKAGSPNGRPISGSGEGVPASRWKTPEFFVYYLVFLLVVPMMFKVTYIVSKESHPNYPKYSHLLSPGWIPGRRVDNSDSQYSNFRDNIPYILILLAVHPLLRRLYNTFSPLRPEAIEPSFSSTNPQASRETLWPAASAKARLQQRVSYDLIFAFVLLCGLHGFSALKILVILYINYFLATRLPRKHIPLSTWVFNIGILFANELCKGYQFSSFAQLILPWSPASVSGTNKEGVSSNWGSWLDSYGGLVPRWEISFNITVLRLISFNLDYYWSLGSVGSSPIEKKQLDPSNLSERDRVSTPAKPQDYSLANYLAYALYSPLYLAGPILTFNDYIAQLKYPPPSITTSRTVLYGIRFLITLLCMEFVLHFIYAVAISKSHPAWEIYTPFQLSMLGYFNLHIIWLKLLLPWRFFRLWALLDGIDPPENMVRCMSDNYSSLAFWRGWHRSFNRWIVRYIYIPLGGSGGPSAHGFRGKARAMINFLAVFTFVALWHDINLKLLMWGWLISLFVLPEVLATFIFPERKWRNSPNSYRLICGIGAVGNILMMMAANLVGFAVGLDGLQGLVRGIVGSYTGLVFLTLACAALFVGVQIMFEVRQQELRQGIRLKC
ncbi:MAG: glycerol transporter [Candelina submexicana]|nr:MAG: glycerol transporter [Candelina submexicana]